MTTIHTSKSTPLAGVSRDSTSQIKTKHHVQREQTAEFVKAEIFDILAWKNPTRSAFLFGCFIIGVYLTEYYSWFYLGSYTLTLIIGFNLIVVVVTHLCSKTTHDKLANNPYRQILEDRENRTFVNKKSVLHYVSMLVDILEMMLLALIDIVCVKDNKSSVKWLIISLISLLMSSFVSGTVIFTWAIVVAFVSLPIYSRNQALINARIQQLGGIVNARL
ncbi:hypothetical protein INT47_012047 [Mucor saturninus]|uniref:Reticulon-like protein n=1 Tax=Mucor saturninus TaxID=64648 RepID=A0A8H7UX98_9FUNG|nr:hypothetical protein INT47_012047 [Mucor saturninus]